MLLHLTARSSAYMENIWAWVSDHDIDSSEDQTQIDVYVARGQSRSTVDRLNTYALV